MEDYRLGLEKQRKMGSVCCLLYTSNQVLVKIMNIGICGSDIHVYHGKHPFTKYPVTQGHEVSGEITELGKNVRCV